MTAFRNLLLASVALLAVVQSGRSGLSVSAAATADLSASLRSEFDELKNLYIRGEYAQAVQKGGFLLAREPVHASPRLTLRALCIVGGAQLALARYRDALATFLPAREIAYRVSDSTRLVAVDNNIAWIYLKMDNLAGAAESEDQALAAQHSSHQYDPRTVYSRALIYAKMRDFSHADALFSEAINYALDTNDLNFAAEAWYLEGRGYATAHRNGEAEFALTESFRLRKLHHLPDLEVSLRDLAEVLAERGDFRISTVLMNEAVAAMGNPKSTADTWGFLLDRGRLRMMQGNLSGALPDLREALTLARHLDVIPTDDDRVTFESGLAELYSLFIDCGNRLYLQNHDSGLKAEIFEASEENRAASLRALVPQPNGWRTHLTPEHDAVLGRLQDAERELLAHPGLAGELKIRQLRVRLEQFEAEDRSGESKDGRSALQIATTALDPDTAILSFHLGPSASWVWLIAQNTFEVFPLPKESLLAKQCAQFRSAIRSGAATTPLSDSLGTELLGQLPAHAHRKGKWIVALDQELFDLPLSALRLDGRYLIEDHAILITPGVRLLKAAGGEPAFSGKLIAIGDPIYNRADPRWESRSGPFGWNFFSREPRDPWHFPRLVGSGEEARSAVASWGNGRALTGKEANKKNLLRVSREQPTIIHLATHVIRAGGNDGSGVIVLGLNGQGEPEFLDMRDIVQQSMHVPLVVMSGCASGYGEARPATGLMGLTRAWLGSGVDDVLATRWPSLDENGPFYSSFYSNLQSNPKLGAAGALQKASLEMLRSRSFRAKPEYWASYFLIGKA